MTQAVESRTTPVLGADSLVAKLAIYNDEIVYPGNIVCVDYTDEAQMAADTAGLKVIGIAGGKKIDNADDGLYLMEVLRGIFRFNNSTTYPIPRSAIGQNAYVEDDNTVAGFSTNLVPAGIVHDVDDDGVWVDMRAAALALAWERVPKVLVAKTDDYTVTAALAFQGRSAFKMTKSGGLTLTLPSAVAGYRVGVMRGSATATDDVNVQAATGDKVQGYDALSAAAKKVENTVDAISGIVWFRAVDDTIWALDNPMPADIASWVKNDA